MSKEQTPIQIIQLMYESPDLPKPSEKGFFFMSNQVEWLMEQYAQYREKKALEREVPKAHTEGQAFLIKKDNLKHGRYPIASEGYYQTQVKPKYE